MKPEYQLKLNGSEIFQSIFFLNLSHRVSISIIRALVRAGATGARALAEIWQRVQGTCPDKGAILVNSKKKDS